MTKTTKLVTFIPAKNFSGYPDGKKRIDFVAGTESVPVTEEYAQMLRENGLAKSAPNNKGK